MERTFIFLSRVLRKEFDVILANCASSISLQQLLLKNRGNANHTFVTHLFELRVRQGLTIADITRLTGISYDNYIKYEKGLVKPQYMNLDTLKKLSNIFGENLLTEYHIFKQNSQQIVIRYKSEHRLSISQFAQLMNVSKQTIKHWLNGTCSPSYEKWKLYFKTE